MSVLSITVHNTFSYPRKADGDFAVSEFFNSRVQMRNQDPYQPISKLQKQVRNKINAQSNAL